MPKKRYSVRKDAGKIRREHDEKILSAMRDIFKQEIEADETYTDADVANMICGIGLLTNKGQIYDLRLKHEIPNKRERGILNFAKRHRKS